MVEFVFLEDLGGFALSKPVCRSCGELMLDGELLAVSVETGEWQCWECSPEFKAWASSS